MLPRTLVLLLLILTLTPPVQAQRIDGLDQPMLSLNRCGSGDPSETHFTLAATGDTFPHRNIQARAEAQGYDWLFDAVRPFLQAADLAYTNLDGPMLEGVGYSDYPRFNYSPALATALRDTGISLVSTANNHILDRGPPGIDATLEVLEEQALRTHGAVRSDATDRPPFLSITLTRGEVSITIGFVAATWGTNGLPDPYEQVNLLYATTSYASQGGVRQSLLDAVAAAAAATDLVLVAPHWGFEYESYPHESQLEAARRLTAAGADIILGAQSHTLQPVDLVESGGRQSLVIYSLANFLASQGAFQQQYFAATSVIFYVGLARAADGTVRVTGYRYLPTIHVDNDTRPAPLRPGMDDRALTHVRTIMRDPEGLRQLPADPPPNGRVEVCPALTLAEAVEQPIPGDFAQHYVTLGDQRPRPLTEAITALGLPLGSPTTELAGDCTTPVPVLYTERQRLELHTNQPWPYRVIGTQIGVYAFQQRYPDRSPERRTNLSDPAVFADSRFQAFYEQYGGLNLFGYPISGALNEDHPETGVPTTVQYFERARFELAASAAAGAPLNAQVQLGLLGRELQRGGAVTALCGGAIPIADLPPPTSSTPLSQASPSPLVTAEDLALIGAAADQLLQSTSPWMIALALSALSVALLAIFGFAFIDWRRHQWRGPSRGYRRRRTARERFAQVPAAISASSEQKQPSAPTDDDELLRQLLK